MLAFDRLSVACLPAACLLQVIQNAQALDKINSTPQEGCLFL
jgi:hypothetical protein